MEKHGWQIHFVGPHPDVSSVYDEPVNCKIEYCHYTKKVAPSRYFSIMRNRAKGWGIGRMVFGLCQLISLIFEKALRFDPYKHLENGMIAEAAKAVNRHDFQLVAGYHPDFKVLETAYEFSRRHNKRLLAIYDDPYGAREAGQFFPSEPERQSRILDYASGVIFMSPLTRDRYVEKKLVAAKKAFAMHDSFPDLPQEESAGLRDTGNMSMVHLGNLPSYRPIDSLLAALERSLSGSGTPHLRLDFYGHVYPQALRRIKSSTELSQAIHAHKEVTHCQSHEIAGDSDVLVVVIGPRHIDNVPSKFFEYLCHHKPVLVIGPKGNPVEGMVETLGVGVYSDVSQPDDIVSGLVSISKNYDGFRSAYTKNKGLIDEYSAERTARRWAEALDACVLRDKISC